MNQFKYIIQTISLLLLASPTYSMHRMRQTTGRMIPKPPTLKTISHTLEPKVHPAFSGYDQRIWDPKIHKLKTVDSFIDTSTHLKPELIATQTIAHQVTKTGLMPALYSHPYHKNDFVADYRAGAIGLSSQFHALPPASQYLTLLHEYRHYLQDISGLLNNRNSMPIEFYDQKTIEKSKNKPGHLHIEDDADRFAATQCSCPTCLKIGGVAISLRPPEQLKQGYFSLKDLAPFIEKTKNNQPCPAHSEIPGNETHNEIVRELHQRLDDMHKRYK